MEFRITRFAQNRRTITASRENLGRVALIEFFLHLAFSWNVERGTGSFKREETNGDEQAATRRYGRVDARLASSSLHIITLYISLYALSFQFLSLYASNFLSYIAALCPIDEINQRKIARSNVEGLHSHVSSLILNRKETSRISIIMHYYFLIVILGIRLLYLLHLIIRCKQIFYIVSRRATFQCLFGKSSIVLFS